MDGFSLRNRVSMTISSTSPLSSRYVTLKTGRRSTSTIRTVCSGPGLSTELLMSARGILKWFIEGLRQHRGQPRNEVRVARRWTYVSRLRASDSRRAIELAGGHTVVSGSVFCFCASLGGQSLAIRLVLPEEGATTSGAPGGSQGEFLPTPKNGEVCRSLADETDWDSRGQEFTDRWTCACGHPGGVR